MVNSNAHVYLLVKPDIFIREQLKQLLDLLGYYDLKILAFKFSKLTYAMYTAMYIDEFNSDLDFWSLNKAAYDFGPVLGLLCQGQGKIYGSSLQSYLKKMQGSAVPEFLEVGTLRYELRAKSRTFNCIHIPGAPKQALKEALLFFGKSSLKKILKINTVYTKQQIFNCYQNQGYFVYNDLNPELNLLHIQSRILHSLSFLDYCPSTLKVKIEQNLSNSYSNLNKINHMRLLYELKKVPMVLHLQTIFKNINAKKNMVSTLDFFWSILKELAVFYLPIEKYILTTSLVYPSISNKEQ